MQWFNQDIQNVALELKSSLTSGLTSVEAKGRLARYGRNELEEPPGESRLRKLLKQFTEFIIVVLIGAAVIAGLLGEWVDSMAIMAIVLLNGIIGFTQEEKAEKVLESLKKMSAPKAKVFRDGELAILDASNLVPGDIIELTAGDRVPADARVLESKLLRLDEASLTGESHAIEKDTEKIIGDAALGDRINSIFAGTIVVYGRGRAIVTETGMASEMGKIAAMLSEVKSEPTPLQKKLSEFARLLVYIAGAICALIFLIGVFRGDDMLEMFLTAVSLAVAAIPEGLPAVVTIVLALGVQRMVKKDALVRKLPSVETLGSATIIASDKTGTLTQNKMMARKVFLASGEVISVTGTGYEPSGTFFHESKEIELEASPNDGLLRLLKASVLCNESELIFSNNEDAKDSTEGKENKSWNIIGDPTEGALLTLAMKAGVKREALKEELTLVGEIPFDSDRKMMTSVFRDSYGRYHSFTKGAPEMIVRASENAYTFDGSAALDIDFYNEVDTVSEEFASEALRVLAFAYKESDTMIDVHDTAKAEQGLTFLGLVGLIDPPREEVFMAVKRARDAGIVPLMITGDHKLTAIAIAEEIGIYNALDNDEALTGVELDLLSNEEFLEKLPHVKVYARVNPEHKLKIVRAWRERGDIVAMTGDGVNDAPALKEADIGIAMGITGTDVTKEASEMVLTDDNFASIVSAVEEGRGIFDNIRKVVHFLLSCNIGEILVLLVASIMGMPLPLLPIHILWTNLVTDGLPALGLAMEKIEDDVMARNPRSPDEGIVTGGLLWVMTVQGIFMAVCTLSVYVVELYWRGSSLELARTMAFTVLVFCQKFHAFNCRSERKSVFKVGVFSNSVLNLAVLGILLSQIAIIHIPALRDIFKVAPLGANEWLIVVAASIQPLIWMEVIKFFRKREL